MAAARAAIGGAADFDAASRALLELAAAWTPDALASLLRDAMELAAFEGRDAVFADAADDGPSFAEIDVTRQEFRQQIEFLTQKRSKPTRVWTDALRGDHDRAFVVAGVTDMAMLEEFHTAVINGARTYDIKAFAGEFDRLVTKYGWSYNGGRSWRIRTIFETNIRTSYMAGRLRQMRDPDMVKAMPWWEYIHADTRVPLNPRPQHLEWNGLVLAWDDPWWDIHYPPNDWVCSCGVRGVTRARLKRLGKDGPDKAPEVSMEPARDPATGATVMKPKGVGFGWDYQPGKLWEQGLVPSALIDEAGGLTLGSRHLAQIDTPEPMADLLAKAKPFIATPLPEGLQPEAYVEAFLQPFGAEIGKAVLFEDKAGAQIPISDMLFRDRSGSFKVLKRGREVFTSLLAETLLDPDEIWIGVASKPDRTFEGFDDLVIDRRYIRTDRKTGLIVVFEIGRKFWDAITAYNTTDAKGEADLKLLDKRRGGKLIWKRK